MKNILFIVACFLYVSYGFSQESKFGITAGYLNLSASSSHEGSKLPENSSGFFAGILGDFALSESFHVEPAAIYGNAEDLNILFIPILAKYYISGSGFNVVAGPQGTLILDEINHSIKRMGWDLTFGAGYDLNENIFLRARYALEITNRYNDEITGAINGVDSSVNTLFAGVGYKF